MVDESSTPPPPRKLIPAEHYERAMEYAGRGRAHAAAFATVLEMMVAMPYDPELSEEVDRLAAWLRSR
jgi:hypothetical protein